MEYISDDDDEEQASRYQTDRIMLPSPRVSIEEREVGFLSQKSSPSETNCLQSKLFRCRSWCGTQPALRRESWQRTQKPPPQSSSSRATLVAENSTQLPWRGTLRSDDFACLLTFTASCCLFHALDLFCLPRGLNCLHKQATDSDDVGWYEDDWMSQGCGKTGWSKLNRSH